MYVATKKKLHATDTDSTVVAALDACYAMQHLLPYADFHALSFAYAC